MNIHREINSSIKGISTKFINQKQNIMENGKIVSKLQEITNGSSISADTDKICKVIKSGKLKDQKKIAEKIHAISNGAGGSIMHDLHLFGHELLSEKPAAAKK